MALTNGFPVLIEDVGETVDPMLDSVLCKQFIEQNGQKIIKFANKDLLYNEEFALYMTTKMPNPHYLPEIFIKVNVINFTVTFEGLEDQLLADVVKSERPEIEQQRDDNIVNLAFCQKRIKDCERDILQMLNASSPETLLDDVDLISTLESSKMTSVSIKEKLVESV